MYGCNQSVCGTLLQEWTFEIFLVSALVTPEEKQIKKKEVWSTNTTLEYDIMHERTSHTCTARRHRLHSQQQLHEHTQAQYVTACTVVQAVVKAISQSNGKGQILTPQGSETPERISMKLGIYKHCCVLSNSGLSNATSKRPKVVEKRGNYSRDTAKTGIRTPPKSDIYFRFVKETIVDQPTTFHSRMQNFVISGKELHA